MFNSNVAPRRRPKAIRKEAWACPTCNRKNPYYWTACPADGTKRP